MAHFIIQAMAASFYHCEGGPSGTYDMVSIAFGAPALARQGVNVSRVDDLKPHFEAIKAELAKGGKPYSMNARLAKGQRAPNGWKARQHEFRFDEAFGIYENSKALA